MPHDAAPYVVIVKKAATETKEQELLFVGVVKVPPSRRFKLNGDQVEIANLRPSDSGTYICRIQAEPPVEVRSRLVVVAVSYGSSTSSGYSNSSCWSVIRAVVAAALVIIV